MKVTCKVIMTVTVSLLALTLSLQTIAADIVGGGGHPAESLLLDWAKFKQESPAYSVKFSSNVSASDLSMVKNGKIDFAIVDSPISEAELARLNLFQLPFALSGVSIVVNLPTTLAGTLKLDAQTIGKIFSGEIKNWDDPAITSLNPKHELPNKAITIVHSGDSSTDYSVINSYLGSINEKWKSSDLNDKRREWPENSIPTDGFSTRISTLKNNNYSIGFLPMQYTLQAALSLVQIQNKMGAYVSLSDVSIISSTSGVNIENGRSANLSLINKSGASTWPISNFSFIVVNKERIKDDKIIQLLNIINSGLRFGSLKAILHNYVAIPNQFSKPLMARIDNITPASNTGAAVHRSNDDDLEDKKNIQRAEANAAVQEGIRKADERNRVAKLLAEERAREQEIKEAKAAKIAAEEAIKAAKAAKIEAEALVERNRLIAKAEKERADKEKAEKERVEKEQAEKERAIQHRNQKDEDPLEAYRRTTGQ